MRRIKLVIAYDGTNYSGWQEQENAVTVGGTVRSALNDLLEKDVELIGASSTDAGVHAEGNVAVFDTVSQIPGEKFAYALNARLPEDIKVLQSEEVSDNFHPRYTSSHKTYVYQILNTRIPIPTLTRYMHHLYEDIDINLMQHTEGIFIGEHDYSAFCSSGAQVKSKVRTIESLRVTEEALGEPKSLTKSPISGRIVRIEVTGTGFLYNMVRIIAGTFIEIGLNRREISTVEQALITGDRCLAGPTAPAKGLTLKKIVYDTDQ